MSLDHRHYLLNTYLLPNEDAALYQAHVERFHRELKPVDLLETHLVQSLADTQWRLDRIPGLESGLLALGRKRCAPDLFTTEAPTGNLLSLT